MFIHGFSSFADSESLFFLLEVIQCEAISLWKIRFGSLECKVRLVGVVLHEVMFHGEREQVPTLSANGGLLPGRAANSMRMRFMAKSMVIPRASMMGQPHNIGVLPGRRNSCTVP